MSKENHPNFHSVAFVTDITMSIVENVRCDNEHRKEFVKSNILNEVKDKVLKFVEEMENEVDMLTKHNYCDCEVDGPCNMHP